MRGRSFVLVPTTVLVLALVTQIGPPAASALTSPVKVLSLPASQFLPFSNDLYLAYTSNSLAHLHRANVYVYRYSNAHRVRINAPRTHGYSGNFDPGTNRLIYEQDQPDRSDLVTYNLDTHKRHRLLALNDGRWNTDPRISSSFISYLRFFKANGRWWVRMFLVDRSTGHRRSVTIERATNTHWINNGTLGDRYATWNVCSGDLSGDVPHLRGCALYIHDTQTRITKKVPTVDRRPQYGGAVDETNGVMFFARAGHACGRGVTFYQLPVSALGSTPVKVSSLPRGFDLDFTASLALNPTTNAFDYFFPRFRCGVHFTGEIYALRGVSPGA